MSDHLPKEDPKLEAMLKIVHEVNERENNKIILFSTFRHTLAYLHQVLSQKGMRIGQIDGSVPTEERLIIRKRFELPKENDDALDMLLFT